MDNSPSPAGNATPTKTIDRRGDVLLQLGESGNPSMSLLVSSRALSLVSPVFAAMFNGRFMEGQGLSSDLPRELSLPYDHPGSMTLLCLIAHMMAKDLPAELDFVRLADFAVLCDKYNCVDTVRAYSRAWVSDLLSQTTEPNYEKLVFITYVLDLPREFFEVTRNIIRDCVGVKVAITTHNSSLFPLMILDRLQERQKAFHDKAFETLHSGQVSDMIDTPSCPDHDRALVFIHIRLLDVGLWPPKMLALPELLDRVSMLKDTEDYTRRACSEEYCVCSDKPAMRYSIAQEMEKLSKTTQGLCLDCITRELTGDKKVQCRIKH